MTKLCPFFSLDASNQRNSCGCASPYHSPIFIFPWLSLAIIYLQYKLLGTRSRPMDTQSTLSNVCSGYSLEAALSNVNDSFTLSRLMKRLQIYQTKKRNAPLRTVQLPGRSQGIGQFSLYQCKGISYTAASHVFCNLASKMC